MITFANSLGRLLATSLNGKLNELGGYPLAFNFAIITALVAILIVLPVPEARRKSQSPALGDLGRLFLNRSVMLPSILYMVAQYATWASIFGFLPNLAKQMQADGNTLALLVPLNIGVMTLSNLVAGAVIRRIGSRQLVVLTFLFLAGGVAAAALASNLTLVFVAAACIGVANGIGYPIMMGMSIEKIPNKSRATAMGIFQATYAIGMFGGPWLSGILAKSLGGLQPMFGVTAIFTLVLGLFGTRWLTSAGKSQPPAPRLPPMIKSTPVTLALDGMGIPYQFFRHPEPVFSLEQAARDTAKSQSRSSAASFSAWQRMNTSWFSWPGRTRYPGKPCAATWAKLA